MRFEYGQLAPFCTIDKRGLGKRELVALAKEVGKMGQWARDLTERQEWIPSPVYERVEFAILTPRWLGFERMPTNAEILDPQALHVWSKTHLHRQVIELCEPDDAYYIRAEYRNQPVGEVLRVGMTPLLIHEIVERSTGKLLKSYAVFELEHSLDELRLLARYATSYSRQHLDTRWVFRLRALRK